MTVLSTVPYALIGDDDAVNLTDAVLILHDAGFRTLTAIDGEEALKLLEQHADAVTVLFSDVEMPGEINGFDLARQAAERWPDIVILVASGRMQCRDGDLPSSATFIRKPFSTEVVHGHLRQMLPDDIKPEPLKRAV